SQTNRFRTRLIPYEVLNNDYVGKWTAEEEEKLINIIVNLTKENDADISTDWGIPWEAVAEKMGHKRTYGQCLRKWKYSLRLKYEMEHGIVAKWRKHDSAILVHKILESEVTEELHIDWDSLIDDNWGPWFDTGDIASEILDRYSKSYKSPLIISSDDEETYEERQNQNSVVNSSEDDNSELVVDVHEKRKNSTSSNQKKKESNSSDSSSSPFGESRNSLLKSGHLTGISNIKSSSSESSTSSSDSSDSSSKDSSSSGSSSDESDGHMAKKRKLEKKRIECPCCHEELPNPLPPKIQEQFLQICDSSSKKKALDMKDKFCRLHNRELKIIPQGISKRYPRTINYDELSSRVRKYEKELKEIIQGKRESWYRENALEVYRKIGKRAKSPMYIMNRFESLRPGYYGPKGSEVMMETLTKMFVSKKILTPELAKPQSIGEFLQEVLVPETCTRLIQEDYTDLINKGKITLANCVDEGKDEERLNGGIQKKKLNVVGENNIITLQHSRRIMMESSEYGECVNGAECEIMEE
ncbi:11923_t:CDS:2, partial [Acaulospora morrowiae]